MYYGMLGYVFQSNDSGRIIKASKWMQLEDLELCQGESEVTAIIVDE